MDCDLEKLTDSQFWSSDETVTLLNPKLPELEREQLLKLSKHTQQPGHIWVASSGSEFTKLIALSKTAILDSANAVNHFLQATNKDIWGLALPTFHVGGLAILARSSLLKSVVKPFSEPWSAPVFKNFLEHEKITLTSLVPTQIFDLVSHQVRAAKTLRTVFVGGSNLPARLFAQAKELGWPLVSTYGMTETCSQIAVCKDGSNQFQLLPHVQIKQEGAGQLHVKGDCLFTGYAFYQNGQVNFIDPKQEGWLQTTDIVQIVNQKIIVQGRGQDFIKINGQGVNLGKLRELMFSISGSNQNYIGAIPDDRSGHKIVLFSETEADIWVKIFNDKVMPLERISRVIRVDRIPRSPLGKVLNDSLASLAKL